VAATTWAIAGGALAADEPACSRFALYPEAATIVVFDEGEVGPTAGDRRIGRYGLNDAEGHPVAAFSFVATVLPPKGDGTIALHATGVHVFANGTLAIAMYYTLPDPDQPDTTPQDELQQIVTGGTGDFERATGTTTAVTLDDGRRQMTFDLHCP